MPALDERSLTPREAESTLADMSKKMRIGILVSVVALGLIAAALPQLRRLAYEVWYRLWGRASVADRLAEHGVAARERLAPYFASAGESYPPGRVALIGIKDAKVVEVWAGPSDSPMRLIRTYPILGASGQLGPKLREGDRQVPEGIYAVESLHPNSAFHLALRLDYPNAFDRERGAEDGREDLGGDIMIHGSEGSVGCLAMGAETIEDLFVLAAETGIEHVTVILTPVDFRKRRLPGEVGDLPDWAGRLYANISKALASHVSESPADDAGG